MNKRGFGIVLVLASLFTFSTAWAQTGRSYSAGWVPALEDDPACLSMSQQFNQRAYWATCRPPGRAVIRRNRVHLAVDLKMCADSLLGTGSANGDFWVLLYTVVLPPEGNFCACAPVGCCQSPPEPTVFAAKIGSENGVVRVSHSLPVQPGTQIEVRRIELRTDGDCMNLDAKDFEDGSAISVSAGAAVVVTGVGGG